MKLNISQTKKVKNFNFWKMVKKLKNKEQTIERIENSNKQIITDVKEILEVKRLYFEKLYEKPGQNEEEKQKEELYLNEIKDAQYLRFCFFC